MKIKKKSNLVYPLLILSMIFWGSSFVWAKLLLENYTAVTIVFFRLLVSVLVMIPVLIILKQLKFPNKKDIPKFILLAFFEPFLYFLGETNGLQHMDSSIASTIISIIPLCTPFVAYYFLKEKINLLNIIGIIISISGIIVIVFGKGMNLEVAPTGLALLLLAVVAANGYSVMIKKIPDNYSVLMVTFWQNAIGMLLFLPVVLIFAKDDLSNISQNGFVEGAIFSIFMLGFFASTLAFLFYMFALRHLPITKVNVFTNSIPIFTIIISFYLLNESIDAKKITGMFIVILGVIISQLKKNFR